MPVHLKEAILSTLLSESTGNPQIHQTHTAKLIHLSARPVVMAPNMKVAPLFLLACAPTTSAFFMPAPLARLPSIPSGSFSTTTSALSRVPVVRARGLHMSSSPNEDEKSGWELFTADLAKKFTVAAAVAAVALSAPGDALAARSGGRMGGRSFSSPSVSQLSVLSLLLWRVYSVTFCMVLAVMPVVVEQQISTYSQRHLYYSWVVPKLRRGYSSLSFSHFMPSKLV